MRAPERTSERTGADQSRALPHVRLFYAFFTSSNPHSHAHPLLALQFPNQKVAQALHPFPGRLFWISILLNFRFLLICFSVVHCGDFPMKQTKEPKVSCLLQFAHTVLGTDLHELFIFSAVLIKPLSVVAIKIGELRVSRWGKNNKQIETQKNRMCQWHYVDDC